MEITYTPEGKLATIKLIGQLWQKDDLGEIERVIDNCLKDGERWVVMDIERLGFINSQGLGLLVRINARLQDLNGKLILYCPRSSVLEVVEISGFDMFMVIARTPEDLQNVLSELTN